MLAKTDLNIIISGGETEEHRQIVRRILRRALTNISRHDFQSSEDSKSFMNLEINVKVIS